MSTAFRTSWGGSTMLDLLRSSAGDLGPALSEYQRRAAALPSQFPGPGPYLVLLLTGIQMWLRAS